MPARRAELPLETRLAPIGEVDQKTRTVDLVWTTGARVKRARWNWHTDEVEYFMEELSLDPSHVRMDRLRNGAPLLNTHGQWDLNDVIGVVEKATLERGVGAASVRFSERADVEPFFRDVVAKIIRNVSVGYAIYKVEKLPPDERSEGLPILRVIDWEPMEISMVPIGADAGAGTRSERQQRTYPCEFIDHTTADDAATRKESQMTEAERAAAADAARKQKEEEESRKATEEATRKAAEDAANRAAAAELARVQEIRALCAAHPATVDRAFEDKAIADKVAVEEVRKQVLDKLAKKSEETETRGGFGDIYVAGDEAVMKRTLIAEALLSRVDPQHKLSDGARDYRYLSLREMARVCLEMGGVRTRHMSPMDIADRSLMAGGDFPNILADVLGKRLRQAYVESQPTYTRWARRAPNAPDFKDIKALTLSNAPALLAVPAGAEFKTGTLSEGKEIYAITTYGRLIGFTRQAIINDDLRAFERFPSGFAGAARRLENSTVYNILLNNGAMADTVALFHANHGNLPTAAAITLAALGLARALMRKQTGLQSEPLNISPTYLLAGPDKEQEAYQFTSAQYVPATAGTVNEFRAGGRTSLEPIIESLITGTKWFLAASPSDIDTVEYCYLDGSEGVYLESRMGFTTDGVEMKARLDFAAKAIDWRGLVYNSGA